MSNSDGFLKKLSLARIVINDLKEHEDGYLVEYNIFGRVKHEYHTIDNPDYGHTPTIDELPEGMQDFIKNNSNITVDDFILTGDGALICKEGIMSFVDLENLSFEFPEEYIELFNDWKLYAIQDEDGSWHYSMYKVRAGAFANSFVEITNDWMTRLNSATNFDDFSNIFNEITIGSGMEPSLVLTNYFSSNIENENQASYIFADLYIEQFIVDYGVNNDTLVQLPILEIEGEQITPQQVYDNYLSENDKELLDQYGAFDYESGQITISDPITVEEYNSILIMNTGNSSSYGLAAEIKYHSDHASGLDESLYAKGPVGQIILNKTDDYIQEAGIVTNAGIGEESESGVTDGYLDEYGSEIDDQQKQHT